MPKAQITSIKRVTDYRWLNLYAIEFVQGGKEGSWLYTSRHEPKAKELDAVVVIPILPTPEGNKLVLVKEYRFPIQNYEIHNPAGLVDEGEDIIETARRELLEETGYELTTVKHISPIVVSSAGLSDESVQIVFAECKLGSGQALESFEDIEVMTVDLEGIREILRNPPCTIDGKCWQTLYMYDQLGAIK